VRSARVISLSGALAPLWLGLMGVTGVAAAAGEPAAASARLEVHALPDCTTREELTARVAARSRRIHFDDDAPGPTLRAIVAPTPRAGAVGELQIVERNGRISTRRISAPSCAEATDAIALIIALTLDPTATATARTPPATPAPVAPPTPAETPTPPGSSAPPPPDGEAPNRSAPAPALDADKPPSRPPLSPQPAQTSAIIVASPAATPVASRSRFGAGAGAAVVGGPAPSALPGLTVYLLAGLDRDALWSPAAIVWGTHAWSSGLIEPGGTAAFTLDAITLDACALRGRASAFEARACASGLLGRLAATGSETYSPVTAARPYAAAGGSLLLSAAVGRLAELSGRLGCSASLIRDSFAFSPSVFHRTDAATLAASLGVGIRFP
jgi:hypothetical protein